MLNIKFRPETLEILRVLDKFEYACLWVNCVPLHTFSRSDGKFTIDRYVTKFVHENQDFFVDGVNRDAFDEKNRI